jgi:hypothetical protein
MHPGWSTAGYGSARGTCAAAVSTVVLARGGDGGISHQAGKEGEGRAIPCKTQQHERARGWLTELAWVWRRGQQHGWLYG